MKGFPYLKKTQKCLKFKSKKTMELVKIYFKNMNKITICTNFLAFLLLFSIVSLLDLDPQPWYECALLGHFPSFFLSLQEIHPVIETPSKASIVKEKSRATLLLCARVLR